MKLPTGGVSFTTGAFVRKAMSMVMSTSLVGALFQDVLAANATPAFQAGIMNDRGATTFHNKPAHTFVFTSPAKFGALSARPPSVQVTKFFVRDLNPWVKTLDRNPNPFNDYNMFSPTALNGSGQCYHKANVNN